MKIVCIISAIVLIVIVIIIKAITDAIFKP